MEKVLVVDDTKNIRMLLKTCLEIEGYDVITAIGGQDALEMLQKENVDMAFIDIKMPEISGTEVLRNIRAMGINIPIVIMTAFATIKNAVECTKLGAVAYMQKPFTAEKVKCVLAEIENYKTEKDSFKSYIDLSKKLIEENKDDKALKLLKKALAINPSCADIYFLISTVLNKQGSSKEAEKFLNASKIFGDKEV